MNDLASESTKMTSGDILKTGQTFMMEPLEKINNDLQQFTDSKYVFCKLRQIVNFAKLGFHKLFHLIILINVFHKMKIKTESSVQTCCPEKLF